jgi:hypothetical protein
VKSMLLWPILFGASLLITPNAWAQIEIPSTLECTASSKNPGKTKPFASKISFMFANNSLQGERATNSQPGKEVFTGLINPNKAIKITGRGAYYSGADVWRSEYSGTLKDGEVTVLRGSVHTKNGHHRDCSITFLLPSDKLAAILNPSVTPNTRVQQDGKTARQLAELQAEQEKLALATKDLNDRQKALDTAQQTLKHEQAKTSQNVSSVQKELNGIVLPTTEDRNSWMMRVAAVPVQQQQFCRIVDQFYDNIDRVYQTRNDIKKNTLFRDRQLSMAALLPHGEFSNWVVQVKEVTQAPDGSAAVMLQPPCRVMLGSDACQSSGSKVQATIPTNSPVYRELGRVSAGDFVVVSGRILYAEASENKPLPTYAVYQPGSHCSATQGSKQEDVFVTEISYLVQLR